MKPTRQATISQFFNRLEKERTQPSHTPPNKLQARQGKDIKGEVKTKSEIMKEKDSLGGKKLDLVVSGSESEEAGDKKQEIKMEQKQELKTNVQFYLNKRVSQPNGDLIDNIHKKWWGDFDKLEEHHGFIQWLFPNAFQSRFNSLANPLSLKEAKEFQDNIEIAKRYQTSYIMMLEFYGMKLKCKQSGEIARSRHPLHRDKAVHSTKPFFEERFHRTLLTSFHNHMRITRILSSLVMCGFGRYAKQLSIFLNHEINDGALRNLKKYGVYERQWKQYAQYVEKQQEKNILLKEYEKHE